jgi:hypothetical protein
MKAERQKKKRSTSMKMRIIGIAAALLSFTFVAGQCHAQTQGTQAKIPFAFVVGDKTLPAGEYAIAPALISSRDVQLIRELDGSSGTMIMTAVVDPNGDDAQPRLIFHRYGNEYFLWQIWASGTSGRELHESRREKELATTETPKEIAVLLGASAGQP